MYAGSGSNPRAYDVGGPPWARPAASAALARRRAPTTGSAPTPERTQPFRGTHRQSPGPPGPGLSCVRAWLDGAMDLETLVTEGHAAITRTTEQHTARWGLGTAQRWSLDQGQGRIVWGFEDHVASAPVQVLGSWNAKVNSFVWSWDNASVAEPLCRTAVEVRTFGAEHGIGALTASPLELDEPRVRDLVALAFRVGQCTGLYHPFDGALATYLAFGAVTLEEAGGTSVFEVPAR